MQSDEKTSLYQKQKAIKPLFEDVVPEYLSGEKQLLALGFAAYLRENRMSPTWSVSNTW